MDSMLFYKNEGRNKTNVMTLVITFKTYM